MNTAAHNDAHIHADDRQLCLDFVNTVGGRKSDAPNDHLGDYADLVAWSESAGTLTDTAANRLRQAAVQAPAQAAAVFRRAGELREALYRIFVRMIGDARPTDEDLARLNVELGPALAHLRLAQSQEGYAWVWETESRDLDQVIWPVARSAAELLTSDELDRVRECANETCGWLFIDRSRNRSRRWCDMSECGNVAKVRRYRQRHKE